MPSYDCFISYSSIDVRFARAVANDLAVHGLTVFLSERSLVAGQQWSSEILEALRSSDWVIFLAGKAARESPYVLQEVGGAIYGKKGLIPVVWDCSPAELPGWAKEFQAVNLSGMTPSQMQQTVFGLARHMTKTKTERARAKVVVGSLVVGFLALLSGDNSDDDDDDDYDD